MAATQSQGTRSHEKLPAELRAQIYDDVYSNTSTYDIHNGCSYSVRGLQCEYLPNGRTCCTTTAPALPLVCSTFSDAAIYYLSSAIIRASNEQQMLHWAFRLSPDRLTKIWSIVVQKQSKTERCSHENVVAAKQVVDDAVEYIQQQLTLFPAGVKEPFLRSGVLRVQISWENGQVIYARIVR